MQAASGLEQTDRLCSYVLCLKQTIFSSSLVQFPLESSSSQSVSDRGISLFLELTGGLTFLTVTAAYLWGRQGERGVAICTTDCCRVAFGHQRY